MHFFAPLAKRSYNQQKPDILLIAVTSQINSQLEFGEMLINGWEEAGLIKLSAVKPIITTLEKHLVIKKLGKLAAKDVQSLKNLLQQIIATKNIA